MYTTSGCDELAAYGGLSRRTPRETRCPSTAGTESMDSYSPLPIPKCQQFKALIDQRSDDLRNGTVEDSYLSFSGVTTTRFQYIESHRRSLGMEHMRLTYFPHIETLIVKVPSEPHEKCHYILGSRIRDYLRMNMGIAFDEVVGTAATKYQGKGYTIKEPDASFKNLRLRSQVGDWPHWVIEAGMSESMQRLRGDATWWINHTEGEVLLVILIWIRPSLKIIKIETWVPERTLPPPGPRTRSRAAIPTLSPRKEDIDVEMDFSVDPPIYKGPLALTLQFSRLIGRPPVPPREKDVVLTRQDLLDLAGYIWKGIV